MEGLTASSYLLTIREITIPRFGSLCLTLGIGRSSQANADVSTT